MDPDTQIDQHKILDKRLHFLSRRLNSAQKQWNLLADGDRVLLGLSGGKDSVTLLHLLPYWRQSAPIDFSLTAMHVEMYQSTGNDERRDRLTRLASQLDVELQFGISEPDAELDATDRKTHPCFRCAWKRRRALFTYAGAHGFNKVALAHHLDDAAQTILMNLLFKGDPRGMEPRREFFDGKIDLIRPLILAQEKEIRRVAAVLDFECLGCLCDEEIVSEREHIGEFLNSFGRQSATVKRHLWRAAQRNVA